MNPRVRRGIPVLALAVAGLAATGCETGGMTGVTWLVPADHLRPAGLEPQPVVLLGASPVRGWPLDPYTLVDHAVEGDTLTLGITHAGGCAEHRFALLVGPDFMESFPVQVHATLAHDAAGDLCLALLAPLLRFDLTRLRQAYGQAYGAGPGTLILHVAGQAIRYDF